VKKNKGFTLVELIVTVSILGLVMAVLGGAIISTFQAFTNHRIRDRQHRAETQARLALLAIVRDIRLSHEVLLVDTTPVPDEAPVLILRARLNTGAYRTITYTLGAPNADNLRMLTRTISAPHGSAPPDDFNPSTVVFPPTLPLVGAWTDWPINYVPAQLFNIQIVAASPPGSAPDPLPAGSIVNADGWTMRYGCTTPAQLATANHLYIRLWIPNAQDGTPPANPNFNTTVAIQRMPN
jgi:prepilin-type N-terminal cleavage/methylation domain-containing protein